MNPFSLYPSREHSFSLSKILNLQGQHPSPSGTLQAPVHHSNPHVNMLLLLRLEVRRYRKGLMPTVIAGGCDGFAENCLVQISSGLESG